MTDYDIENIVRQKIEREEKLGEYAGGSGHLSYVSYELDYINKIDQESDTVKVIYFYTIYVCSEFTYYPNNPPYEYHYKKTIEINSDKEIISETEKEIALISELPIELVWQRIQSEINRFLELLLSKIEWYYGDNRAPFCFPAIFKTEKFGDGVNNYICVIETDLSTSKDNLIFESKNPWELLKMVKSEIKNRFGEDLIKDEEL